jgi:hypothetical protein
MKTKVAWFSPVVPQPTDIANYTERLRADLDRRFDMRYFVEEPNGVVDVTTGRRYPCDLGHFSHPLIRDLNCCDVPVYHIGNNGTFHAHTWTLSRTKPGIVVLHDRKLHHIVDWLWHHTGDRDSYVELMRKHYGELGAEAGWASWHNQIPLDFIADHFPLTELAVENALAVIVHTRHSLEALQKTATIPVFHLPLPYPSKPLPAGGRKTTPPGERRRIIIFGFLSPNRRIIEFLTALAGLDQRHLFDVDIAGEISHEDQVKTAIADMGLGATVKLHGFVEESALDDLLARADLAINLRYPSLGEASGTQLRIWDNALPSIVTQTEAYADLPVNTVFFARPDHEIPDIRHLLLLLLADPQSFRIKGENGKKLLERDHAPADYVSRLASVIAMTDRLRRRRIECQLAETLGRRASAVLDASLPNGEGNDAAEAITDMLG